MPPVQSLEMLGAIADDMHTAKQKQEMKPLLVLKRG
jgi:hypothetical protein